MRLNSATIQHYRSKMIPTEEIKKQVCLNEEYLREKPTWYSIDNKLQYFKIRNDFRIFTELFYNKLATTFMDLQSLDYYIASIRTIAPAVNKNKEETKKGLLSINFQDKNFNHYLVSELMQAEISDFVAYGGYSLESLLKFFKDYISQEDYKTNELFLIKLFILDGFTYQVDRNPNNIAFQIPRIKDTSYKDRLHIEKLKKNKNAEAEGALEYDPQTDTYRIKGFIPNVVYDNERILGVDHKDVFAYDKENCWIPELPYSNDLRFGKNNIEQANNTKRKTFDGLDPNLASLYMNHQEVCEPYFERLAYDDEYRKILEDFTKESSPVILSSNDVEYVTSVLQNQQKELRKIITY